MAYQVKTPWWLRRIYNRGFVWQMPAAGDPAVYLTFDDGPHPEITPFVLEQLRRFNAKATFFCIGKNVTAHPTIYEQIQKEGHSIGNHTHNHLNGWQVDNNTYISNIQQAAAYIDSRIFRPPYGRIKFSQANALINATPGWKIIMWDVLSGDFDTALTPGKCLKNVIRHTEPGSIVVFHDSDKARVRMEYALPRLLQHCSDKNWKLKALT